MEETVTTGLGPVNAKRIRMGERQANQERYERVNRSWPKEMPALTEDEARAALKRLWRIATGKLWGKRQIVFTSGNRRNKLYRDRAVINCDPYNRNGLHGWKWFVHSIAHWTHGGDHGTGHASHEAWLVHEVVSRGWLDGKLKRTEKPKAVRNVKAERHQRAIANLARWTTKQKRAATAIKKLMKQIRYYERQAMN